MNAQPHRQADIWERFDWLWDAIFYVALLVSLVLMVLDDNRAAPIWLGWGLESADVTVKDNQFTNITVDPIRNYFPIASYCIKNNTLDGAPMTDDCPK